MGRLDNLSNEELLEYYELIKKHESDSDRSKAVRKEGQDWKYVYHLVRLISEVEQILTEGDLDIQKNREQLKSVRRGEWTLEQVKEWFYSKEKSLGELYQTSTLQHSPDEERIKRLLLDCLEEYYGSLEACVVDVDLATKTLQKITELINEFNRRRDV